MFLMRNAGEPEAWFRVVATNITSEENLGGIGLPSLILNSDIGPHFHDPDKMPGARVGLGQTGP